MSEAMTAPVEPAQVPVPPHAQEDATPTPVERSTPVEEKPAPEAKPDKPDLDTAIKRAFDRAQAEKDAKAPKAEPEPAKEPKAAEPKAEAKAEPETPEAKAERERNPDGKFKAKDAPEPSAPADKVDGQDGEPKPRPSEGRDYSKPPAHFLPRAKEAWATVNPDVQGEVHRMAQNYEKGIAEYKESHENWSKLKDFDQIAKSAGTTVPDYLRSVYAIDQLIRTNPVEGIKRVLATANITPEQYARHILQQSQQPANPQAQQQGQLQQTVQQLTQKLSQMEQRDQQREEEARLAQVAQRFIEPFKADHPRYDELESDIAFFLKSGKIPQTLSETERLEAAYDMAERINPAPKFGANTGPGTPAAPSRPLDPAGTKSITGAPTPGLSTTKAPSKEGAKDLDAILRRSLAKVTAAR